MERQRSNFGKSEYFGSAAIYQPNEGQLKRTLSLVLLLLTVLLIGIATKAHADGKSTNYVGLAGCIYAPGSSHDLDTSVAAVRSPRFGSAQRTAGH